MAVLVRKINKAKWRQRDVLNDEEPSADAITNCLKTSQNSLSVWTIDDESHLSNAILALAAGFQRLDTFDVALINEDDLVGNGLTITETPGITPYSAMIGRHRDISDLDYGGLGKVASLIISCLKNETVKRYTKSTLIDLLRAAVLSGDVRLEDLQPSVQKELDA